MRDGYNVDWVVVLSQIGANLGWFAVGLVRVWRS